MSGRGEPGLERSQLWAHGYQLVARQRLRAAVTAATVLLLAGCVPDPARGQAARLLDELVQAHTALSAPGGDVSPTCDLIGGVDTRLTGEPGLVDLRPTWPALRAATDDLLAACGHLRLLATPGLDTPAVRDARHRWQHGAQYELTQACGALQSAADSLGRPRAACSEPPSAAGANATWGG